MNSITTGGGFSWSLTSSKRTMSALVPGQEDLKHRVCLGPRNVELLTWFREVETEAWGWVNDNYPQNRPKEIFLVIGQTLTTEYSISHFENGSESCEIFVAADITVPAAFEAEVLVGRNFEKVTAAAGFQKVVSKASQKEGPGLHSIFLEVEKSPPITRLHSISRRFKSLLHARFRSTSLNFASDFLEIS